MLAKIKWFSVFKMDETNEGCGMPKPKVMCFDYFCCFDFDLKGLSFTRLIATGEP